MTGNKNKILITGASGNLGSWMMEHFASSFEVVGLSRQEGAASPNGEHRMVYADITNEDRLKQILVEEKPAIVIHLASVNESFLSGYADLALAVNAGGTAKLLRACAAIPLQRFIYFSTFHVYGKNGGLINEYTNTAPANDYALTHFFAEQYVQMLSAGKFPFTIFRLSNSYGCPLDKHSNKWYLLFNDLCRQAIEKKELRLKTNGKARRDFIPMKQVVEIVEACLAEKRTENSILNLGSGISRDLLHVTKEVALAYQSHYGKELPLFINEEDQHKYPDDLVFSVEKLKSLVPFEQVEAFQPEAIKIFQKFGDTGFYDG